VELTPDEERGIKWSTERLRARAADMGTRLDVRWHFDPDKHEYLVTVTAQGLAATATMDAEDLADCGRGDQTRRASAEITFGFTLDDLQRRRSSSAGRN
jgi:hypothetical protein